MALNNAINSPVFGGVSTIPAGNVLVGAGTATVTYVAEVPVTNGGTGAASLTGLLLGNGTSAVSAIEPTVHAVLVGDGASGVTALDVGTNGQVLLGSTGVDPVFATLTSTDGTISFSTGAGSLNLEVANPAGGLTWADATGAEAAVAGHGYFSQGASNVLTLPALPTNGVTVAFASATADTYQVVANAGQVIFVGSAASATAGNITSGAAAGTAVTLVYSATATAWIANNVVGSFTTA